MNHLTFKSCKDENVRRDITQLGIPYLGVELEVESKDQDRAKVCREILIQCNGKLTGDKVNNFVMLKTDGSLDGRKGIEIVTAPATLKYHKQAWKKFFDKDAGGACDLVHSFDNTNNRCGMHVHISRNAFTALSFGKFLQFINDEANLGFITKIAGRSKSHYTKFIKKKVTDCMRPLTGDKYEAVNLRHTNTLEVRIFKGNSRKEGFFKNIEFVHAVWNFSNDTSLTQLSYTDFLKWIPGKQYEYPYLTAWLIFNGYLNKDILPTSGVNTAAYAIIEKNIEYRKKVKSKKAALAKKKANSKHRIIEIVSKDTYVQPKVGEVGAPIDMAMVIRSTGTPIGVPVVGVA